MSLYPEIRKLVNKYGLEAVHRCLREMPGFCGNCGCVQKQGELHSYMSMGGCQITTLPTEAKQP